MKKQKLSLKNLKVSSFATEKVEGKKGGAWTRHKEGSCVWDCGGSGGVGGSYDANCLEC